jgi:hypothetical protein
LPLSRGAVAHAACEAGRGIPNHFAVASVITGNGIDPMIIGSIVKNENGNLWIFKDTEAI